MKQITIESLKELIRLIKSALNLKADKTEIPTKVSELENDQNYINDVSDKQDVIEDLETIRSGSALGATSIQVETDPTVPAWAKEPNKPEYSFDEINNTPTALSDFSDDLGDNPVHTHKQYLVADDISNKADKGDSYTKVESDNKYQPSGNYLKPADIENKANKGDSYTKAESDSKYLTQHQDISGKADKADTYTKSETYTKVEVQSLVDPKVDKVSGKSLISDTEIARLANVTNYNDTEVRGLITGLTTRLNTLANSDDDTLDQMSEIVAYIKSNKDLIDNITTSKVSVDDIINDLAHTDTNKPLSANQGKVLKDLIDAIVIPTKVSAFENDKGYLTEHQDISGKVDTEEFEELKEYLEEKYPFGITNIEVIPLVENKTITFQKDEENDWYISTEPLATNNNTFEIKQDKRFILEINGEKHLLIGDFRACMLFYGGWYDLRYIGDASLFGYRVKEESDEIGYCVAHRLHHDQLINVYSATEDSIELSLYRIDADVKTLPYDLLPKRFPRLITGDDSNVGTMQQYSTMANPGNASHAEGILTNATGQTSHAEGLLTESSGSASHAEGYQSIASGYFSHAEGQQNIASGQESHVEGGYNFASGLESHVEGQYNCVSGNRSHAEGQGNFVNSILSHAEGSGNVVNGALSHVQGINSISDDDEGKTVSITIYEKDGKTVVSNVSRTLNKYAHIVGNGTSESTRSNAHTLDWEGNAWYSGDVYVGSTSGTNKDSGSKKLATENYVSTEITTSIDDIIIKSETQPESENNQVWFDESTEEEIELLTIEDLKEIEVSEDEEGNIVIEGNMVKVPCEGVEDVKINGESIVNDGVAEIPIVEDTVLYNKGRLGLVSVDRWSGLNVDPTTGRISVRKSNNTEITARRAIGATSTSGCIDGSNFDFAVKAAMCDGVGTEWTKEEQSAARERIGIHEPIVIVNTTIEEDVKSVTVSFDPVPWAKKITIFMTNTDTNIGVGNNNYISWFVSTEGRYPHNIPIYFDCTYKMAYIEIIQNGNDVIGLSYATTNGYALADKHGLLNNAYISKLNSFTFSANGSTAMLNANTKIIAIASM